MHSAEEQPDLKEMHRILKAALPDAQEKISWSMPTFWKEHNICHFAASKKHIGFYPSPEAVAAFAIVKYGIVFSGKSVDALKS